MEACSNNIKKKRRFSQQQFLPKCTSSKSNQNIDLKNLVKFRKFSNPHNIRKSIQVQRIGKPEQNVQLIKRSTEWNRIKIDNLQFQKILQKRKKKNRFNFNSIELRSIQHRSLNSFIQNQSNNCNQKGLQLKLKQQKSFSLARQAEDFTIMQNQYRNLLDQQIHQKAKYKLLRQLILYINQNIRIQQDKQLKQDKLLKQDKFLSQNQKQSIQVRKQRQKMDYFTRQTNQIQQKIINYKKQIVTLRSQRVVYSSIFKELQKQIKQAQIKFNNCLINSMEYIRNLWNSKNSTDQVTYGQDYQRSQVSMNSYMQYKSLFKQLMKTSVVKFNASNAFFDEQKFLNQKINSNTALNYYTQSRKIIVLPRYKQHYQSSRKKIKLEKQQKSYEQLVNRLKKIFQFLQLDYDPSNTPKTNQQINNSQTLKEAINIRRQICDVSLKTFKNLNQLNQQMVNHNSDRKSDLLLGNQSDLLYIKKLTEKATIMFMQIPRQNQAILSQIDELDQKIAKYTKQTQTQISKLKLFRSSYFSQDNPTKSQQDVQQNLLASYKNQKIVQIHQQEECLAQLNQLLFPSETNILQQSLLNKIHNLQQLYLATKTKNMFKQQKSRVKKQQKTQFQQQNDQFNTDRSDVSIKFKKIDQNIQFETNTQRKSNFNSGKNNNNIENITNPKDADVVSRGPKTLNSMLKNIQVYDSYQRAFQRMDFQKEYVIQKNKKKRTLNRRDGMVSLCLLKKQTQQKARLLKRKSSNKRQI